jgi:hypothetical protein
MLVTSPRIILLGAVATVAASSAPPPAFRVVVLPAPLEDSMAAVWLSNNRHWDELGDQNFLQQALGTGKPTQHEYLGCLVGEVYGDTLWVRGLETAVHLRQLQFAVAGDCDQVAHLVGTWHTHPYRASLAGTPLKERGLSPQDLATFADASDLVSIVMWDRDSLDVAARTPDGHVVHPAPFIVR